MKSFLVFTIFAAALFDGVVGKSVDQGPIEATELKSLLDDDKVEVGVFDVRPQFVRETEGYIKTSYPVPEGKHQILATFDL